MSIETTKQKISSLLDEVDMYTKGRNPLAAEQQIEQAKKELCLLSKKLHLREFKEVKEGLNKILEERAETNRLLSELLNKHYTEEHELTKALNSLYR